MHIKRNRGMATDHFVRGLPGADDPVHVMLPSGKNMLCWTGSWHVRYIPHEYAQTLKHRVTCEECKKKLRK